jgi:hypothetical protein
MQSAAVKASSEVQERDGSPAKKYKLMIFSLLFNQQQNFSVLPVNPLSWSRVRARIPEAGISPYQYSRRVKRKVR